MVYSFSYWKNKTISCRSTARWKSSSKYPRRFLLIVSFYTFLDAVYIKYWTKKIKHSTLMRMYHCNLLNQNSTSYVALYIGIYNGLYRKNAFSVKMNCTCNWLWLTDTQSSPRSSWKTWPRLTWSATTLTGTSSPWWWPTVTTHSRWARAPR